MTLFILSYKVIHLSYNQLISCSLCSQAFISPREYTSVDATEPHDKDNEISEFYIAFQFVSLERLLEILHSQLSIVLIGVSFIMSR